MIRIKRIYEPPDDKDGTRVLVDRIWPRGISRREARIDFWDKDVAPTTRLRQWFGHKPERWKEFEKRYRAELKANPALAELRTFVRSQKITLLYAARDTEHNHARVLCAVLSPRKPRKAPAKKKAKRKPRK